MCKSDITLHRRHIADSKVHGANMGPIWGWQDPVGPHVGPMNFAIWESVEWLTLYHCGWTKLCFRCINLTFHSSEDISLIARFLGPTWGPSGADKTKVGPMLAPWTLLSGKALNDWLYHCGWTKLCFRCVNLTFLSSEDISLIARFLGPTWGPSGGRQDPGGPHEHLGCLMAVEKMGFNSIFHIYMLSILTDPYHKDL